MDAFRMGCADVADYPASENPWGCRQLIGNVWEWTADTFNPFDGFAVDDYKEYSMPLFGDTKVLRGGSWATRSRYINARYRNYFPAHRHDIFAGFRTCARD
jgi:iron(II)-dependent oxidoreductase